MRHARIALVACAATLACTGGENHPSAPADGTTRVVPTLTTPVPLGDEATHTISGRVASRVGAFGGAYVDARGQVTIYLTDPSRGIAAQNALGSELVISGRMPPAMRVRYGRYTFADLTRFKRAVRQLLLYPGVSVIAIDERANRISITTSGSIASLLLQVQRYGVPRDAVSIVATGRVVEAGSIDGSLRPAVAGLHITGFFEQGNQPYSVGCSYGPNVRDFADTGRRYMVTSSHCGQHSPPVGGYVGAEIYQPDPSGHTNLIGTIVANPQFTSGGVCPIGALCRMSDAALVRIDPTATVTLGSVVRPIARVFLPTIYGPTAIDASQPPFAIAGYTEALVGDTVDKIGGATGWTAGVVTATCADVNISGYVRLCSGVDSAGAGEGDSGAPVLYRNPRGRYYVAGILYGFADNGSDGRSGNVYYFSSWTAISEELGGFAGLGVR